MPQRQTKFSETWLSSVDSNGQRIGEWCRKGQNEYQAYCQFCDVQVKCDNAGKTQLLQHSKQKKHIDAIKHSVDKKQKKLVAFSKQSGESSACSSQSLGLITPGDSVKTWKNSRVPNFLFRLTNTLTTFKVHRISFKN